MMTRASRAQSDRARGQATKGAGGGGGSEAGARVTKMTRPWRASREVYMYAWVCVGAACVYVWGACVYVWAACVYVWAADPLKGVVRAGSAVGGKLLDRERACSVRSRCVRDGTSLGTSMGT